MQAVTISTFGGPDVLRVADVAVPEPGPGQVRVKVRAAAVHPVDLAIRAGAFAELLPGQPRYVLGWDLAGTVDAVGAQVTATHPGDAVVGLSVWLRSLAGTQAEFVALDATGVAAAPEGASWVEAATLPLNALAAVQALDLMPQGTRSVAITGAAGAGRSTPSSIPLGSVRPHSGPSATPAPWSPPSPQPHRLPSGTSRSPHSRSRPTAANSPSWPPWPSRGS